MGPVGSLVSGALKQPALPPLALCGDGWSGCLSVCLSLCVCGGSEPFLSGAKGIFFAKEVLLLLRTQ